MYLGIDGGGTRTTIGLADAAGRELARLDGPPGIVDPRWPLAAAESVIGLARQLLAGVGVQAPLEALCAGLAGTGSAAERDAVRNALLGARIARRVDVCSDGEIALEGALGGGPGVLLVAGTGSIGWGRAEDGRVERCGGWGMILGDEGSAYGLARAALSAALQAFDGRGPATSLLPELLSAAGLPRAEALPPWVARAGKSDVAALAPRVVALAEQGDEVAGEVMRREAAGLAAHGRALVCRLGPWTRPVPLVLHGGLTAAPAYADQVTRSLAELAVDVAPQAPQADAVTGAIRRARAAAGLRSA